jgi:molybdopterin-guanine dinucleotide biosynthesis protein A
VAGVVLTGGASARMGRDKTRLGLGGVPGAVRAARLLASSVEDVILVGGDPPPGAPGRRVPDPAGPACALRGLVGGLAAAAAPRALVLATDLPFVPADLLLALVAWPEAEAVVPWGARGPEPLCALYECEPTLRVARARLEAGELALQGVLAGLRVARLDEAALAALDPEGRALTNLNTPDDLARAEAWLARGRPREMG